MMKKTATLLSAAVICLGLAFATPVAAGDLPMNPEEKELLDVEGNVLTLQRELSAANARGDDPKDVQELREKFDKLQKRRVELLRKTWQM